MIGALPESLMVGGEEYPIRTDYRNVLDVFEAFTDPELGQDEKWEVCIYMLFEDFACADDVEKAVLNGFDADESIQKILWFISAGQPEKQVLEIPVYSWVQDEQLIFSAVNKVATREVRDPEKYLHWWTFLGYFNEVGEGTFSFVVGIRNKLNKGKKLEKHEKEFLSHNKELVLMKKPLTKEEQEQEDAYKSLLDEVLGK